MRTTTLTSRLIAIGGLMLTSLCIAASSSADKASELKKTIESRYPEVKVLGVQPAKELPGLYEIFTGTAIVYSDASGDHLIAGPLLDTRSRENVTAERLDTLNGIDFSKLPLDLAIKTVKGDGKRVMAVFADPDCPYCQRLEHELVSIDNVTVYTFLYPVTELHPDAEEKARKIWCSPNRSRTWTQWMVDGKLDTATNGDACSDDPIDSLRKLAGELRVNGTPTIFFANGRRVGMAMTADQIEGRLKSGG